MSSTFPYQIKASDIVILLQKISQVRDCEAVRECLLACGSYRFTCITSQHSVKVVSTHTLYVYVVQ